MLGRRPLPSRRVPRIAIAALLAAAAPARADDRFAEVPRLPDWIRGVARYKAFVYPDEGRQENDRVRNQVEADLELAPSLDPLLPGLRAETLFRAVWDDEHLSAGVFDERDERRPIATFREAFLAWEHDALELRVGRQIFAWGKADLFNPTDTLNPRDYTDLLDNEKIGVDALTARWFASERLAVEAVFVPVLFTPNRLPPRGARYDLVPPDFPIRIADRDIPPDTLASSQYGVRLSGTVPEADLDWALTGHHGFDHWPNLKLRVRRLPQPPFFEPLLEPFYKKQDVAGLTLSRVFGPLEAHGEAGYFFHSERSEDEYVHYVAGGNWRKATLADDADELFLVLEYAGLAPTDRRAPGVIPGVWTTIFRSALLARARYSWNGGDLVVETTAALLLHGEDSQYVQAKAAYRVFEWLKLTVGTDILSGSKDSFFGQFRDDDRGFLFLEASF